MREKREDHIVTEEEPQGNKSRQKNGGSPESETIKMVDEKVL